MSLSYLVFMVLINKTLSILKKIEDCKIVTLGGAFLLGSNKT